MRRSHDRAPAHAALVSLVFAVAPLHASDIASRHADAALALACFSCHGSVRRDGDGIPALDASRAQIASVLLRYKRDVHGSSVMHRISKGFSDDELARIAAYVADPSTEPGAQR